MKKLIIFQNELSAYDVENFNNIAEEFDLTVAYYLKDKSSMLCNFKKIKLESKKIGPFVLVKDVYGLAKQHDVVSILPDLHILSYWLIPFLPRKFKVVNWSIGFRVSYIHPYITDRKHNFLDWVTKQIINHCDASIFYMEKAKEFWEGQIEMKKIFVSINTTSVIPIQINPSLKNNFLFVGTLYQGKGLDKLLGNYKELVSLRSNAPHLIIIGEGEERGSLESFVKENNLNNYVTFCGAIYDETKLAEYYQKALLSVSPNQAGLSVPKSMGYGVPYVTRKDAITGGELYHIKDKHNGLMYEKDSELLEILIDATDNPQKFIEMGFRAKEYYDNNATVKHRSNGALSAFKYALGV